MFTGIIQTRGRVAALNDSGGDARIEIAAGDLRAGAIGGSVAVNGVCLTIVEHLDGGFAADVSRQTLDLTSLGKLAVQDSVNLEPALCAGEPLGGHLVSGHVDGLAELQQRHADARSVRMRFAAPAELARYIAARGSVTLDGISLTVNAVERDTFDVNIVPHTLDVTTLGERQPGDRLNLEVDMLARYVERLLQGDK